MWTQGLNPEQVKAVEHDYGPLLILAGAGSGKTTVLVSRTGRLIANRIAQANQICVLTFTNKAARELKHRVQVKLGDRAKGLWAGTFHSFGLMLLKTYHQEAQLPRTFGVIDQSDSQSILRELMRDIRVVGKDKFDLERLLKLINDLRVNGKFPLGPQDEYHELAQILAEKYQKKLNLLGVVDFEDLLLKPIDLLKKNPAVLEALRERFQQVMVDEFQDTNEVQMRLVELLAGERRNLTVVGDDDQSIYGWRGAQISNILDFPKKYKGAVTIRLERNYRSSSKILDLANHVISKNAKRHGKVLKAEGHQQGDLPEAFLFDSEDNEAEFVGREISILLQQGHSPKEIAVLYRSNSQGGLIESILRRNHVPYTVSGGTGFFDRKEVKDILAYLRLSFAPNDLAARRVINVPPRGIGDTSVEKLIEIATSRGVSFFSVAKNWRQNGINEKLGASLDSFFAGLDKLNALLANSNAQQVGANLLEYLREIKFRDYLYQTSSSPEAGEKRWMMLEVFSRVLEAFYKTGGPGEKTLREFLESMELRDEPDSKEDNNKVSLMTLHACKGLEFPIVYIVGIEEDILPHRTLGSDVDEERRLFYVGLTRAQKKLILSRCKSRKRNGQTRPVSPSRFLLDIPQQMIRDYKSEYRPVTHEERGEMVSSFLAKLDQRLADRPVKKDKRGP